LILFEKILEFRGLSREILIDYLLLIAKQSFESLIENEDHSVTIHGKDWNVSLSSEDTFSIVPTIVIPRLYLTFHGDEEQIQEVIKKLRNRTLRTGG